MNTKHAKQDSPRSTCFFLFFKFVLVMFFILFASGETQADTLVTTDYQMTTSYLPEFTPALGNDGLSNLLVLTQQYPAENRFLVWLERFNFDPFSAQATVISEGAVSPDVSGDYIVYNLFTSPVWEPDTVVLYQISTGLSWTLGQDGYIIFPRINGSWVVWCQGPIMLYNLDWRDAAKNAIEIANPRQPSIAYGFQLEIGDLYIVWVDRVDRDGDGNLDDTDVMAYELATSTPIRVTNTPGIDERGPSTSGPWVVWEVRSEQGAGERIEARNMSNNDTRVVSDNHPINSYPSIDGDLVAWVEGWYVYVHRLSISETYQVTTDQSLKSMPQVFGNLVTYVDHDRAYNQDIWLSTLEFIPTQAPIAEAGDDQTAHAGTVVTLDGSGSSDPDGDAITYSWQIMSTPVGSAASLSDSTIVNPSFTADMPGDYTIELVVTDSQGAPSAPDQVIVSTFNTAPVADAGPDQAVTVLGTTVQLDGTQSWDPDGDPITYSWTMTQSPAGSVAALSDSSSATPTFIADEQGDYIIELLVDDQWASSDLDTVTVSFANVNPVADAGGNQSVTVGDTVSLDGNGSSDANGDPLTYSWSFVSMPAGSTATLSGATSPMASFVADVEGTYVVSLWVNDGFVNSAPNNATVTATSTQNEVIQTLVQLMDTINDLDPSVFKNRNMGDTLTNKINAVIEMINQGLYQDALDKLENDILKKTNGCAESDTPDKNDWIRGCETQNLVYPLIIEIIALVQNLISGG